MRPGHVTDYGVKHNLAYLYATDMGPFTEPGVQRCWHRVPVNQLLQIRHGLFLLLLLHSGRTAVSITI